MDGNGKGGMGKDGNGAMAMSERSRRNWMEGKRAERK